MRSKKRLTLIVMMIMAMVACLIGAVACGGADAKSAIQMYIFTLDQTVVSEDFSLPKYIGVNDAVKVDWKSSNTDAIAIEDGGTQYTAKVTLQDEMTDVTLTISHGSAKKDFVVRVDEFSVFTFSDNYVFPQLKSTVSADFDLDTSFTYLGRTATIAWAVPEGSVDYLALNETKDKCIVTLPDSLTDVALDATFSFTKGDKTDTTTKSYSFVVAPPLDHRQTVNKIYTVTDYPLTLSGYIVHVYDASEQYGNVTCYVIDDDFCSGYYIYRGKLSNSADMSKVVDGAHITFSGDTTKNFGGLWENNGGGTLTVDDTTPINPRDYVYAFDTDLLSDVPSAIWHESTYVSLSGWKVSQLPDSKPENGEDTAAELLRIERDGVEIIVWFSKYIQRSEAERAELLAWYDNLKVGDYINVTGLLGNHNNKFQIQPVLASDIAKVDAEGSAPNAAKVKAAVSAVQTEVSKSFDALISTNKDVTMPTDKDGVKISYKVAGEPKDPTVTIDGGKISVKPDAKDRRYDIEVTYTIGDFTGYSFFEIHNWLMSEDQIVKTVKETIEGLTIDDVKTAGNFSIPTFDALGATVSWTVEGADFVTVSGTTVTVAELPDVDTTVTLKAHISLNNSSADAEITFKVLKAPDMVFQAIDEAPETGTYKLAMYNANKKATYYALDALSGYYLGTTDDPAQASVYTITKVDGKGYTITVSGKYLEIVPRTDGEKGTNVVLNDSQTADKYWQWNEGISNMVMETTYNDTTDESKTDLYYLGNYSSNTSLSPNYISRIATKGDDGTYTPNNQEGVDQWVAHYGNMVSMGSISNETKAQETLDALKTLGKTKFNTANEEYALPTTPNTYNATIEWTIVGTTEYASITSNTLKIAATLPTEATEITLQLKVTVGDVVKTDNTIKISVEPAPQVANDGSETKPYTVAEALALSSTIGDVEGRYYKENGEVVKIHIHGYIVDPGQLSYNKQNTDTYGIKYATIADEKGGEVTLTLSSVNWDDTIFTKQTTNPLQAGDEVVVYGYMNWHNNAPAIYYYNNGSGSDQCYFTKWVQAQLDNNDKAKEVADALEAAFSKTTFDTVGEEYDLPTYEKYDAQIEWDDGGDEHVSIASGKLTIDSLPDTDTPVEVTITVTVTVGGGDDSGTATAEIKITLRKAGSVASKYGTETAPLSVEQALALAADECATNGNWTAQVVYVKGVAKTTALKSSKGNYYESFSLVDESKSDKEILIYSINLEEDVAAPAQHDILTISGYITRYKYENGAPATTGTDGTIEFSRNTNLSTTEEVKLLVNTRGESTITLGSHVDATVSGITEEGGSKVKNGTTFEFTVTAGQGKKIDTVTAYGAPLTATDAATGKYSFAVVGDTEVTVITTDASAPDAKVLYTLDTTQKTNGTNNNSYAGDGDTKNPINGVTWNLQGNGQQYPWRLGGKPSNCSGVDRCISSKNAITGKVTKVVITFAAEDSVTVNSASLKVYGSDPTAKGASASYTATVTYTANGSYTVSVPSSEDWTNCYYQLVLNLTSTKTDDKNGYVTVSKIEFSGYDA